MGEAALRVAGNHPGCKLTHIYNQMTVPMPKTCVRPVWNKDTNLGFSRLGQFDSEIRDTTQGVFTLLVSVPVSGTTIPAPTDIALILGTLSFRYTVRFYMPSIDEAVLGNCETNWNTGFNTLDAVSTNLYASYNANLIVLMFYNNPIPEQDLNSYFTAQEDYSMAGMMSDTMGWAPVTSTQASTWGGTIVLGGASHTAPSYAPSISGTTGWFLEIPAVAQYVTINVATTFAITSMATGRFVVQLINPDDVKSIPCAVGIRLSDNSVAFNSAATQAAQTTTSSTLMQTNGAMAGGTSSPYTASVTLVVDPSAYRYNASRIMVAVGWSDSANTFSAQSWTGATKFLQIITSALTQDQQVSWGIPAYAPRTLLSSGAVAPLSLSDLGAMRLEQTESDFGFGLGGLLADSKMDRRKLYQEFEKAGGVAGYVSKRVADAKRAAARDDDIKSWPAARVERAIADKAVDTTGRTAPGASTQERVDLAAMFADMYLESVGIPVDQEAVAARIERKLAKHRESLGEELTLAKIKHREERKSESAPKKVRLASPVTLLSPQVATQKAAPVDPPPTVKGTTTSSEKAPDQRKDVQGDTTTDDETEATIVLPLSAEEKALLERRRRELQSSGAASAS
jgi:hypothetical protein